MMGHSRFERGALDLDGVVAFHPDRFPFASGFVLRFHSQPLTINLKESPVLK